MSTPKLPKKIREEWKRATMQNTPPRRYAKLALLHGHSVGHVIEQLTLAGVVRGKSKWQAKSSAESATLNAVDDLEDEGYDFDENED